MSQERDCNSCENHVQAASLDDQPVICWSCSSASVTGPKPLPYWKPMSKAYDAAFRPEEDTKPDAPIPPLKPSKEVSDGSTAGYYTLPNGATELQDLISAKDMNAQMGEIFRAVYRFGEVAHSPKIRDIKKIIFYAQAELKRLEKLEVKSA